MTATLSHRDADIHLDSDSSGKTRVTVAMHDPAAYIPHTSCLTAYSRELIETILKVKGPAWLCDEILRDESPDYVQKNLSAGLLSYVPADRIDGRSILDFGCGSGASTMILARMFPDSEITGVELDGGLLSVGIARKAFYGLQGQVRMLVSPGPDRLPEGIGPFDYIVFSAVFEHLLPHERRSLLPLIWALLKPDGVLFLNETPYRFFPVETHTTAGLPLINYLPDRIAWILSRRFSRKNLRHDSWETMLRKGIRGGSVGEIRRMLTRAGLRPRFLGPSADGMEDRIDLWFRYTGRGRLFFLKRIFYAVIKMVKFLTGITMLPYLSLAIQKNDE